MARPIVGDKVIETNDHRVIREAVRMFTMDEKRRAYRVNNARSRLGQWAKQPSTRSNEGAMERQAAILLSQGVTDL